MKSFFSAFLFFLLFISLNTSLSAQNPVAYDSPEYEYQMALELFQKEKYGSAQPYFKYVYENVADKQQDIKSASYFYLGVCAASLYHNDAIFLLRDFIRNYPVHAYVPEAKYHLAKFYFYKKNYKKALEYYEEVEEKGLRQEDLAEFYFKKGYAYFETKKEDEAKTYLNRARQSEGSYQLRAIYYLAHLAYNERQYQAALEDFLLLKNETDYEEVVPLYIARIYFVQGKYEELLTVAPPLLEKIDKKEKPEMNRIIALSYYNLGIYGDAKKYFEDYLAMTKETVDRNDYFAIGYTYYNLENYKNAIDYLSKTTKDADEMGQNSFYIIGDCYLKINQPTLAMQSFSEAAKYDFLPEVKEDAMYNYAKLQFATSSNPFNSAIKALENYINEYPYSSRSEEATSYLSSIYLSTKNYQGAITSLEKINSKSPELLRAYQRCTHFRALELINSGRNIEAVTMLNKSLTYPLNKELRLSSLYWKAEAQYRAGKEKEAFYDFQTYHQTNGVKQDENYQISFYSLGYSALKTEKYADAQKAFRTFLQFKETKENVILASDATVRLADSYYMQKQLEQAISHYKETEKMGQKNADYALIQQAKCYSYLKQENKKVETLERLLRNYPTSFYNDDAEYELATTYHVQNQYAKAITAYTDFIRKYPKSPYVREAYNKKAQAYLNAQDEEMAISTFKYVFETYPGSQEAKDAMANLETIYTEQGNTSEFFDYIKTRNMNITVSKQDSISFKAGENKYVRGDCEGTVKSLSDYLKQFPNGLFAAKAYYYRAECEYGMNSFEKALVDYEKIINTYNTEYNETALRKASIILYNDKEYQRALTYMYKLLEITSSSANILLAQRGIMYSSYALEKYKEALNAAKVVINDVAADEDLKNEAKLIAGKSAIELKEYVSAKTFLHDLAEQSTNDYAAEAAYLSCVIEFEMGNYDECEKQITDMLAGKYSSGAEYWFASVFILYGDLYAAKENYFQARHTYQSIVDNYEGDDLREIAREKVAKIDEIEKKNNPELEETKE